MQTGSTSTMTLSGTTGTGHSWTLAAWLVCIIGAKPVAGAGNAGCQTQRGPGDSPYRLMFLLEPGEDQLPSAGAGGKAGAEAGAAEGIW
jgi:hypothetical protein